MSILARQIGCHEAYIRIHAQLAFLSPRIQAAVQDGTLPTELTLKRILRLPIPLDWTAQETLYWPQAERSWRANN